MTPTGAGQWLLVIFYGSLTALLAIVGSYYGLLAVERLIRPDDPPSGRTSPPSESAPAVTIQVPVYNERHVVDRLLAALRRLEWPSDQLQIQIIDDSTDETSRLIAQGVAALVEDGIDAEHIRRPSRAGFKAGATSKGLRSATGEFIALFDADFVPPPDFLTRTIPHFKDPTVGCVQTRWAHLNEDYSWFTRAQAVALDAHFAVEQWVRARIGSVMSFNATSCVWRRTTIEDAGGWSSETVAEDLDLTTTALLEGWRFVYTHGYAVPCEIPVSLAGFVSQQTRWARGSAQNARKHLGQLVRSSRVSPWATFHSVMHVAHYLFFPVLLGWLLLHVVVTAAGAVPSWVLFAGFLGTTPGPAAFLVVGQLQTDRPGTGHRLAAIVPLTAVGVAIAWRMTVAVGVGLRSMGGRFTRTPKFRIEGPRRAWHDSSYNRPLGRLGPEVILGAWCSIGVGVAIATGNVRMAPSVAFFALSFWAVILFARRQR